MDLIQKANKLGYKHYTEFTIEELDNLPLGNSNKQIEYYFIQKWLREVHNLHLYIDTTPSFEQMESHKSKYKVSVKVPFKPFKWTTGYYYLGNTYEEALEKGLQEALKLIENEKTNS